jgi:hypothetical protein
MAIRSPEVAAELLYNYFRNPMVHSFGFQDPEPEGAIRITRLPGDGYDEAGLEALERSEARPQLPPTLMRGVDRGVSLQVEPFYWGVREMFRSLTADRALMQIADKHLSKMLKKA